MDRVRWTCPIALHGHPLTNGFISSPDGASHLTALRRLDFRT